MSLDEKITADQKRAFRLRTLNRRWFNLSLLARRNFDGHIVTMNQSGSHWIKNLLSRVLIARYNLPALAHVQDDSVIGHPKTLPLAKHTPQIVNSHGFPHGFTLALPFLHYPKYLVLVRDPRDSLISHYERFKGDYNNVSFDEFLRGDLQNKKFHSDIYHRIRFMNEWGAYIFKQHAPKVSYLRYEDLKDNPAVKLRETVDYFGIEGITDSMIQQAVDDSTKEKMAKNPNPENKTIVFRTGKLKPREEYFTPENTRFFEEVCRELLEYDFGYGLPTVTKPGAN